MAVNLSKNGAALTAAYKDVVDVKSDTNWVLLTYEGNSNDIRLAGTGAGGLEEMVEELSSGKVMYAFCRVLDPNSSLPKYVLINWTGEGVRDSRKGMCANHVRSIASFLTGAHVTVNARGDDDVDPETIMSKVGKASGANFHFNKGPQNYSDAPRGPVGSVYQKTNAVDEIQKTKKDDFWAQNQRDDEARRKEDSRRVLGERQRQEKERRERDEREAAERDRRAKERASQIDQQKSQEKQQEAVREQERQQRENSRGIHSANVQELGAGGLDSKHTPAKPRPGKLKSPFLSQKPTEREAPVAPKGPAPLLPGAVAPVPAPLSPSADALLPETLAPVPATCPSPDTLLPETPSSPVTPSSPPAPASPVQPAPASPVQPAPASPVQPAPASPVQPAPASPVQPAPASPVQPAAVPSPVQPAEASTEEEEYWSDDFEDDADDDTQEASSDKEDLYEEPQPLAEEAHEENLYELYEDVCQPTPPVEEKRAGGFDQGVCAKALYDYQATDDSEITFDPDDIISGIEMVDEGWWRGFGPDGHFGMFPANYVQLLKEI